MSRQRSNKIALRTIASALLLGLAGVAGAQDVLIRNARVHTATAQGYAFQVELTWRVLSLGLTVVELPIRFRERRLGESKMSAQIALEAAWRVPALRYGRRRWRPLEADARRADAVMHEG